MLGEVLRTERERQHLTIQDIEEGTSIRSLYIEMIENANYDKLPGDVYTKGFIRSYASFLNLNGDELVKQFVMERNPVAAMNITNENSDVISESEPAERTEIPSRRDRNKKSSASNATGASNLSEVSNPESKSNFKIIAAVILIAALAAGAWTYLSGVGAEVVDIDVKQEQPANESPRVVQNETTNTNLDSTTNQNGNTVAAAAPQQTQQTQQNGINLQAKFTGECWTQVIADGMLVYEDTARPGQVLNWTGNENITVRLGNAGAVEIVNNGQNIGYMGGIGEVTERTFTKN